METKARPAELGEQPSERTWQTAKAGEVGGSKAAKEERHMDKGLGVP